jgi:hypothetical protein
MLIDNFLAMLADIPPKLAVGWALWMVAGLLLSRWHLQSRSALVYEQNEPAPVQPVEAPVANDTSDPLADLERIFEAKVGSHRMPGESPLLNSAGAPIDDTVSPGLATVEAETTQGRA